MAGYVVGRIQFRVSKPDNHKREEVSGMTKRQDIIIRLVEAEDPAIELRDQRERAGLNQAEAAVYSGVSPSTWYRWEAGQGEPNRSQLDRIADVLIGNWSKPGKVSHLQTAYSFRRAARPLIPIAV
jgi:DNA-binding transcriptional regulator YiaG